MKAQLPKCRLGLVLFMSMVFMACTANDEKPVTVSSDEADHCSRLSELRLPHTVITRAQSVSAGDYLADNGKTYTVPAFCRIQAVAAPTGDSHIKMEIWMPAQDWNGRYLQFAMGGAAGSIDYNVLASRINVGNAVATTDTGHASKNLDWDWAPGHPEKIIDFGYRAHKETSDIAKAIVEQYYGRMHNYAYFSGCSRGGHAGLVSAQRYPDDWDGILVGAAPADLTKHFSYKTWLSLMQHQVPKGLIKSAKLPAIQRIARASCTAEAHMVDGIPADPRFCRYDTAILLCKGEETDACLTAPQVDVLRNLYDGPVHAVTGGKIYPGVPPTMEATNEITAEYKAWFEKITGMATPEVGEFMWVTRSGFEPAFNFLSRLGLDDMESDITKLKPDDVWDRFKNKSVAGEKLEDVLKANIDWRAFSKTNTKMLMYYGWADAGVSPELGIEYYNEALDQIGDAEKTQDFLRLFMVPGLDHCLGGPGANAFGQYSAIAPALEDSPDHDIYRALEAWVEKDVAPEKITAVKYMDDKHHVDDNKLKKTVAFTRPLCVYPHVPVYKGTGDIKEASSFECRTGATPP